MSDTLTFRDVFYKYQKPVARALTIAFWEHRRAARRHL